MKLENFVKSGLATQKAIDKLTEPETEVKAEHTALPWKVGQNKHGTVYISSEATHQNVVDIAAINLADAAFICKAVNVHEELVTALKALALGVRHTERVGIGKRPGWVKVDGEEYSDPLIFAEEALAKAEAL